MNGTNEAEALADLLRSAGDLIAAHPEIPTPYVTGISYSSGSGQAVDLNWFVPINVADHVEQKRTAARILKAVGGKWDKDPNPDERFNFTQHRGGLHLNVQVEREAVCERVVTGVESVTISAVAAVPEHTIERDIVEWRCEPVLAEVAS